MKIIKVRKNISNASTALDEGCEVILEEASQPVINLMRDAYYNDQSSISGAIDWLFLINGKKITK